MDSIKHLKENYNEIISSVIESCTTELPDSIKALAQDIGKLCENGLSSFFPTLPAEQRTSVTNYVIELIKGPYVIELIKGPLALFDSEDFAEEMEDATGHLFDRLNTIYKQLEGDVNDLTGRCNALEGLIDFKDAIIRKGEVSAQAALRTQAALQSTNAAKDAIIAAQGSKLSLYEKNIEQLKLDADFFKETSEKAIKTLNNKQNASTALLKNAGSVLGSRLNIAGIAFVALGAILLLAAYYYKDNGSFTSSTTRFDSLNKVIDRFNSFMKDYHLGVARLGCALAGLGTVCLISSKVAMGRCVRDVQGHLSLTESFFR